MSDWMFDIVAIAVCCLGFFILFSLMRMLWTILKLGVLATLIFFLGRSYLPSFSLSDLPVRQTVVLLADGARYFAAFGKDFLSEVRKAPSPQVTLPQSGPEVFKTAARK